MPLQNRVDPYGELHAISAHGGFLGNRGGKLHRPDRTLGARRWASKSWICCRLKFKNRRRDVMNAGYTELFFLDEATALAAGHRPCYECRRADALAFAEAWASAHQTSSPPRAPDLDNVLHVERLDRRGRPGRSKRLHHARLKNLPPGAMFILWGAPWLVTETHMLRWSFHGYTHALRRIDAQIGLLTPPSIVRTLAAGYRPAIDSAFD